MSIKIKQQSLVNISYNKIKHLILSNYLKPGDKIVQEGMAKRLGISKIPLRQALSMIEKEGLVESIPRKGFYVKRISQKELNEVLDLRFAVESLSVILIISSSQNDKDKVKAKLINFIENFKKFTKENDRDKYFDTDRKFHYSLVQDSKNTMLININEAGNIQVLRYTKGFELDMEISLEHHIKLVNTILDNDITSAVKIIKMHFDMVKESIAGKVKPYVYQK